MTICEHGYYKGCSKCFVNEFYKICKYCSKMFLPNTIKQVRCIDCQEKDFKRSRFINKN